MKRIFVKGALRDYWEKKPETEQPLRVCYEDVMKANWKSPADAKKQFETLSILKGGRLVFNIRGNSYRLVADVNYDKQLVYIRFIGTHEEYDRIDANSTNIMKLIKSEEEYQIALKRLGEVFNAPAGTPESDECDILALLVGAYDDEHYPIDPPDPIEAIKIRMEEMQLKQADLADVIGSKSRVSEVLNRKRKLNLEMIRSLSQRLHIPVSTLVTDYQLSR